MQPTLFLHVFVSISCRVILINNFLNNLISLWSLWYL